VKNCARNIWKKPHLFYHEVRSIERQHNLSIAEEVFMKSKVKYSVVIVLLKMVMLIHNTTVNLTTMTRNRV
jgi:hypothetical protein